MAVVSQQWLWSTTIRKGRRGAGKLPGPQQRADIMARRKQLGELRDAGVVTAEEFDADQVEKLRRL